MKNIFLLLALLLFVSTAAQNNITVEEWQKDLQYLQKTVHEQYPFLFKKVSQTKFDAEVDTFYKAIPNMEQHEIVVGFSRMIALFKYGHTRMSYSDSPVPFHSIPVDFYRFKDGLYIKAAHKDYKSIIGSKVIAIEGVPIEKVVDDVFATVPAENAQFYDAYGLDHMAIPEILHAQGITERLKLEVNLSLEKEGKTFDYSITAKDNLRFPLKYGEVRPDSDWINGRDLSYTPNYLRHFDSIYYYEYLEESKTVYVRHSRIRDDENEKVADFYHRVLEFINTNDVEKLVMDVRLNGGGNNYLNKPIITGIISNKKINQPGKFFVITGRRTFSACQSLINELDNYTNVLFVGEPSSENINFYGDNKRVTLPNSNLRVYLSFAWWQDKPQWENADYITPHYPVQMTYNEYVTNQDPVLDVVLNFNSKDFRLDPMSYLKTLFKNKEYELAVKEAERIAKDTTYRFIDFEKEFNNTAYIMLGNDNEGALLLFELSTALFPKSANTWGNLGQAYWEVGDFAKAKKSYKKVLSLVKEGGAATNAKRMLKKIEEKE